MIRSARYRGREQALKRALTNIISNAFDYGKTVAVSLESNNNKLEVAVDDDGPGIPADKREEVFKAFYRLEGSRNKETGGVGLGLSIAKDIITSHGGKIELLDSPIGGLRVLVSIPPIAATFGVILSTRSMSARGSKLPTTDRGGKAEQGVSYYVCFKNPAEFSTGFCLLKSF